MLCLVVVLLDLLVRYSGLSPKPNLKPTEVLWPLTCLPLPVHAKEGTVTDIGRDLANLYRPALCISVLCLEVSVRRSIQKQLLLGRKHRA